MAHEHPEAFRLMEYVSDDGSEREVLWNSRDGVTPFIIPSAQTGNELVHRDCSADRYAPHHVPKVGNRIFVDLTEQRARARAAELVQWGAEDPEHLKQMQEMYASEKEAVDATAARMLTDYGGHAPDILVVTAGYLHELEAQRTVAMGVDMGGPDWTAVAAPMDLVRSGTVARSANSVRTTAQNFEVAPGRSVLFDRQGQPINADQCERLLTNDDYRIVAFDIAEANMLGLVPVAFVSTIWLGVDHSYGVGAPVIFESAVWRRGRECERRRYSTEAEALAGHRDLLATLRAVLEAERTADAAVEAVRAAMGKRDKKN